MCVCVVVVVCTCFIISMCVCVCTCRLFCVYPCGSRQRRQGIMNCAFIPLCTAPFTYPHGEDDGVKLACQWRCSAVLHAAWLFRVSRGIKLGEQALRHP